MSESDAGPHVAYVGTLEQADALSQIPDGRWFVCGRCGMGVRGLFAASRHCPAPVET